MSDTSDPLNPDKQQVPVNQPQRRYGDGVSLERLRGGFPQPPNTGATREPSPIDNLSTASGVQPAPPVPNDDIPAPILEQGGEGAGFFNGGGPTPRQEPLTRPERTIQTLSILAESPEVTQATREWAKLVLEMLFPSTV